MNSLQKELVLKQIACEIKKNRNNLHGNLRNLRVFQKDNKFLRQVYGDYKDYHNFIINQKKDQEIQILRLLHYLEKSLLDANLTNKMVAEAKHEQQILIKKLKGIQGDISNMTQQVETAIDEI